MLGLTAYIHHHHCNILYWLSITLHYFNPLVILFVLISLVILFIIIYNHYLNQIACCVNIFVATFISIKFLAIAHTELFYINFLIVRFGVIQCLQYYNSKLLRFMHGLGVCLPMQTVSSSDSCSEAIIRVSPVCMYPCKLPACEDSKVPL